MLTYNKDTKLTKDEFDTCWFYNPNGAGFAFVENGKFVFKKGFMTQQSAWNFYQTIDTPHVCHFRLATLGAVCRELTHPFVCTDEPMYHLEYNGDIPFIFHNGIEKEWACKLKTITALATFIAKFGFEHTQALNSNLGGRFAVIHENKVHLFGDYFFKNGIFYSNDRIFLKDEKKQLIPLNITGRSVHKKFDRNVYVKKGLLVEELVYN